MARTTILLDDHLLLEIRNLAQTRKTTTTEVVREALTAYIKRQSRTRVPSFTGLGGSGKRSVSRSAEALLRRHIKRHEGW
ncbi:MAG: type II toxin-antitoxin system VapB family antitoxin [Acidobacteria bacterium]|nr:type II toxin-antitoxin system VapB family antitoxin [Acidobacteriota bacterium]